MRSRLWLPAVILAAAAPGGGKLAPAAARGPAPAYAWRLPFGFPPPPVPADNPMSEAKVALGRRLFYEPRLSGNASQSCASCHRPERAFTDGRARARGSTGMLHPRGSMSLANVAYNASFTWVDAQVTTLEEQELGPLLNRHPVELGLRGREDEVVGRLAADPSYAAAFGRAFPGQPIGLDQVRKAIASFERTLLSGDSPYDRLVWQDDAAALSPAARRGMRLFFSPRLACARCHAGFTFSGPVRYAGSAPATPVFLDTGLGGAFRAPTLRNIAVTAPYMHDGRFATLEEVIDYYAGGGASSAAKSSLLRGFTVSTEDKRDLVEFLAGLTDRAFLSDPRFADPGRGGPLRPLNPLIGSGRAGPAPASMAGCSDGAPPLLSRSACATVSSEQSSWRWRSPTAPTRTSAAGRSITSGWSSWVTPFSG
jgi:cytochrome c peroxidase